MKSAALLPVLPRSSALTHGFSPLRSISPSLIALTVLTLYCTLLFFFRLDARDLWSSHEGRAAQDAQTILDDGDWALPRLFDRKIELQKPPLYYWLVALAAHGRGVPVDALAVRLPAALAGLLGVLALYLFGVMTGRSRAGLVAALLLASMQHYTWLARVGRIDMPLALAVGAALGAFFLARSASAPLRRNAWLLIGYLALAAAVLLKGPIGFVLPAAVAGAVLLADGALPAPWHGRRWLELVHFLGLWWGLPLVLALTVPWFVWTGARTDGAFFRVFFWHHNFERGFGGASDLATHPWWFYAPRLAFDMLPWSFVLPFALWYFWKERSWRTDSVARFGLIWFVTMVVLLSCARFKRADYLLPAYPGAALFLGCVVERWQRGLSWHWTYLFGLILAGYAACWGTYLTEVLPRDEEALTRFASEIRAHAVKPLPVIFFRVEDHALAFHVGRPIDTILEWENLDVWASRAGTYYIVMAQELAEHWPEFVSSGVLEEIARESLSAGQRHGHPLVLLRTRPGARPTPP